LRFIHLLLRDYLVFNYCAPKLADQDRYHDPTSYGFFCADTNPASALARTDERACQLLMKLIREKNENTIGQNILRKNAIIALSQIRSEDAVDGLIELLSGEPHDWATAYSIGLIKNPRAKDALVVAVEKATRGQLSR
jgi:HEAT repeat protein